MAGNDSVTRAEGAVTTEDEEIAKEAMEMAYKPYTVSRSGTGFSEISKFPAADRPPASLHGRRASEGSQPGSRT
jgi:hypothetical protein